MSKTGSVSDLADVEAALLRLLPEISGALLRVAPGQMDAEIDGWLERLLRLLSVDRVAVLRMSTEAHAVHSTHSASTTSAPPPFPVVATETELTWLVQQVRGGRVVQLPDLPCGLPVSAERERLLVSSRGVKSYVLVPFAIGRSGVGAMALSSARAHATFGDAVIARLELVVQVIGGALARHDARHTLEERISFEHLLMDLVASVLGATADELDARIHDGLARVIGHFGIDRCSVLEFSDDHASLSRTHYAAAPGVSPVRPAIEFPWYVERMRAGHVTQFTQKLADLPDAAAVEHQYIRELGVQAHLSIPLAAAGRPWGAIGFSAFLQPRRWTEEEVQRLRMVGVIVMESLVSREAEQQRQRQGDELAHVARVAALGELTAALAHELNQPLMAIRLNAQAMRRLLHAGQAQDVDEVLDDIAADATRAGDLIRRLRDLLRRRELAKEVLDLGAVIAGVQAIARAEARRHGAELVVQASPGLPPVVGDEIQLQQVVLNLVRNAAEAMSGQPGPREVRIRTWEVPGEHVTVSVEDDGPPIDDATLAAMFTPFLTTKPDGLGIGLAISLSIVEAHAGRLWAERRGSGGLAVRFALPARPAEEHARLLGTARSRAGRRGRQQVRG